MRHRKTGPLVAAALVATGCCLKGRWTRMVVEGTSMAPILLPGDRLLVRRARRIRVGGLAVVADPRAPRRLVVKRVAALDHRRKVVTVLGDNAAASTDSRTFGPVPLACVRGVPVYRYAPAARAGRAATWGDQADWR